MARILNNIGSLTRRCLHRCFAFCIGAMLICLPLEAASPKWETSKTEQNSEAKSILKDSDTEILITPGKIIVVSTKQVQIKVYTILGQLVSRETLPAGTSHLAIHTHGVYIIRTGDMTCKVAL